MRCTSPSTVGFYEDGKTLCWSPKKYSKQYATFQLPCGKCLACRLESARETAVRCVHEAQMYENNSFITLTYSEENLKSDKLQYRDFQLFIKKLRKHIYESHQEIINSKEDYEKIKIGVFVTGEYGDKTKRPHWHTIIFNWKPTDAKQKYQTDRGDTVYDSETLTELWGHGIAEFGSVTFESASYCARYATKKLVHGRDGTHDYNPISKRSSKQAIGKKWIEQNWKHTFENGFVVINEKPCSIPRYYQKWFKKTYPEKWKDYVTGIKSQITKEAILKEEKITLEEKKINMKRSGLKGLQIKRNKVRNTILKQKFKESQKFSKF